MISLDQHNKLSTKQVFLGQQNLTKRSPMLGCFPRANYRGFLGKENHCYLL
jgi:hypothetical protein